MATTLRNYWHPIGTSAEIVAEPRPFTMLGERLVAYRDAGGPAAFLDLCIHRGAALSGGTVENGAIVCPYHGWAYDRSGACVRIPSLPAGAPIPAKARAIPVAVREAYGLVWVALDAPAAPFPAWPDDAWTAGDKRVFLVNTYLWKSSAGRVVENAMDFSHFNFVHMGYTELADGPVVKPYEVDRVERGFTYAYEDGRLRRDYLVEFPFIVHDRKSVVAVGNGGTWSESADTKAGDVTTLSFIAAPIDETTTRIYAFIGRNHSLARPDAEFGAGFDTVMEQDRVVVETQRPERIPTDIKEELHLRFPDAAAILYRRMLRELEQVEAFVP